LGAAAATPTCVLNSAALTTNALIGAVFNGTNPATMTPRASWTERADVGYATPTSGLEVMSRDSGETATSIAWGGTSASAFCASVFELDITAPAQDLTPSLFTNSQTFHAPTITTGAVTLSPGLFTNSQTFHAPTVLATYALTPGLFTNTQTFYAATVSQASGPQTLTPSLFTNDQTFYAPTVTPGAVALAPALLTNQQTFYGPTVSLAGAEPQTLSPSLFVNEQFFYPATIRWGWSISTPPPPAWSPTDPPGDDWDGNVSPPPVFMPIEPEPTGGIFDEAIFDSAIFDTGEAGASLFEIATSPAVAWSGDEDADEEWVIIPSPPPAWT
jgi:hypothetical protein